MKEVSADKAYLGAENLLTTLRNGAIPYIPFKSNSVAHSRGSYGPKSELWTRMYHFYALNRAEFLQHYYNRSNVKTTFHMIKSKFGQRLRSRTLTAQINEALCKVLCHNLCVVIQSVHELGIETNFEAGLTVLKCRHLLAFGYSVHAKVLRTLRTAIAIIGCVSCPNILRVLFVARTTQSQAKNTYCQSGSRKSLAVPHGTASTS
jgi:hypothetical protein